MKFLTYAFLCTALCTIYSHVNGATYTAINSGNYSSNATWQNGQKPPTPLGNNTIQIDGSVNVTLDENIILNTPNSDLVIYGNAAIISTSSHYISYQDGNLIGYNGSIDIDSMYIGKDVDIYNGHITVNVLKTGTVYLKNNLELKIKKRWRLTDVIYIWNKTFSFNQPIDTPTIVFELDGWYRVGGNSYVDLTKPFRVRYENAAKSFNMSHEQDGKGLLETIVDIGNGNTMGVATPDTGFVTTISKPLLVTSGTLDFGIGSIYFEINNTINTTSGGLVDFTHKIVSFNYSGTDLGTISCTGNCSFNILTINSSNPNGVLTIKSDLYVSDHLQLNSGKVNIGNNHFRYNGMDQKPTGASMNSYIILDSNGSMVRNDNYQSAKVYPIGTANKYLPVKVSTNNSKLEVNVGVTETVKYHPQKPQSTITNQPHIGATWKVNTAPGTNFSYDLTIMWDNTLELHGFDRNNCHVTHYRDADWDKDVPSAAVTDSNYYTQTRYGINYGGHFTVFDGNTVDVPHISKADEINIYPNPVSDVLHIKGVQQADVHIYNTQGQLLLQQQLYDSHTINVADLPSGMYYLQILSGEQVHTRAFNK